MKILVKNYSRYTLDGVSMLARTAARASYVRLPDDVTVYVNNARGKFARIVICGRRSMQLYLPAPKFVAGGPFYDYLDSDDHISALRCVRWAMLIIAGRSNKDLNADQRSFTGPVPWAGLMAPIRERLTKQAPNKEAGAAKLHANKIKKAGAKVEYYNKRAGKAVVLRTKWERKLRALKSSSHLVGKPRGHKPKPLSPDKLAELDRLMNEGMP